MTLKSYLYSKAPRFTESINAPIHLGDYEGRHYYVFADEDIPPSGGRDVSDEEGKAVIAQSRVIRQIKEEAGRRILEIAPLWKQQNALADLYLLGDHAELTDTERETLIKAKALLKDITDLRERSNQIEASFLNGVAVDYLTDKAWEDELNAK